MTPQEEIEELLSKIALGDRNAFSLLYDRTSAKLFSVCLRVLKDRTEAEEALQEAFLRIWHRANMYRTNGYSPMTWLITLTRNIAIDRYRKAGPKASEKLDLADVVADDRPGPEAQVVASGERARLEMCLKELPADRAVLIERAYLDGDTYQQLSDATGIKLNTIRTWLRRSLQQLRECLVQ